MIDFRKSTLWGLVLLCAILIGQGAYGSQLNGLYYSRFSPFYDSAAYTNQLAQVMWTAKQHGVRAAVLEGYSYNTVLLPWLEASVLSFFVPPTRTLGVWMQEIAMFLFAGSVFLYLHYFRRAGLILSLIATVALISFEQVYFFNGGISDFRMDLSLYALMGATLTWYLATYETQALLPWVVTAGTAALCVLNRATAPAYLGFTILPLLLVRFAVSDGIERRRLLRFSLITGGPLVVLTAAYLWSKWGFLHYYYFVYGPDPTAHLPFREGARHFVFALRNAGTYTTFACLAMGVAVIGARGRGYARAGDGLKVFTSIDWRLAWYAVAPPLLLALEGAGANPFVAMPAVYGGLLFAMVPLNGSLEGLEESAGVKVACALLAGASLLNAAGGVSSHRDPPGHESYIQALKEGAVLMEDDARKHGLRIAEFATFHVADFDAMFLRNVLQFDFGGRYKDDGILSPAGVLYRTDHHYAFSGSAEMNWTKETPGRTDEEKAAFLVRLADEEMDYIFLPDESTLTYLETRMSHNYINRKIRLIRRKLLESATWERLGPPLVMSEFETVCLYSNVKRAP